MTLGQASPGRDLRTRYLYVGAAMLLGLLVLVVRVYRLQITRGEELGQRSAANFVKEVRLRADRGMVLDSQRRILVDNRPSFDLFVTPAFCGRCEDDVLPRLAELLTLDVDSAETVARRVRRGGRRAPFVPIPIQIDLTRDEVDRVNARLHELPGVELEAVPHRSYPTGKMLSHVLGFMNEITRSELQRRNTSGSSYRPGDYVGRRGLERAFEEQLRGDDGLRKVVVDAHGKTIAELNDRLIGDDAVEPRPGNNLVLSIDMRLQEAAEEAFPGKAGAVVAVDVRTGFIKALVSRPGFDSNQLTGRVSPEELELLRNDPLEPMVFRASKEHYSPGSTFKVVTALAALRAGVDPEESVVCNGGYWIGRRFQRCWSDRGHGPKDFRGAMKHSCDVWYYHHADHLGIDAIAEAGRDLGLGERTGLGVLAEEPGIMPSKAYHDRVSPDGYTRGMALNTSIGQGDVNVTPLQLAMVYAAIANGGTLHRPQLVERIETADGDLIQRFPAEVRREIELAPEHHRLLVDALTAVVNERGGTAYWRRPRDLDVKIAGKTGTAQVAKLGKVRLKTEEMAFFERDHAWFAGFAPVEAPELAVVVLNEHGGHGGSDAAPTAMALFRRYFELKAEEAQRAPRTAVEVKVEQTTAAIERRN